MAGFGPVPEPGPALRDDTGRTWQLTPDQNAAGVPLYTCDGRQFATLPELHLRTDLFLVC
jgi:hypothetical protein